MSLWEAVLLGVVQGLTEFLPISSTAHLVAARELLGHATPNDAFTTVIQLGTLVAVLWYFRADIVALVRAVLNDLRAGKFAATPESRLAWLIVFGTIPVVLVGGLYKDELKNPDRFYNLPAMAWVSIVFALLMAAADVWAHARRNVANPGRRVEDIGWATALWVGCWQALALMPGASRSGTTITAGLFAGLARPAAARFSFLLSLPAVFAAGVKELYDEFKKLKHPDGGSPSLFASADDALALAVGLVVSAVVGYLAIAGLLAFLRRYSLTVFVVYRIIFGVLILLLLRMGYLHMH